MTITTVIVLTILAMYLFMAKQTFEKFLVRAIANYKKRWTSLDPNEDRGFLIVGAVVASIFWPIYRPYIKFVQESANGYIDRVFNKEKK